MFVVREDDIRTSLSMRDAIESQRRAFAALASKQASVPHRVVAEAGQRTVLFKPFLERTTFGLKVVSVRADKGGTPATILLFDAETGAPTALMSATYLTALRTAAGSALAAELLCRQPRDRPLTLCVFGAGLMAELHVVALRVIFVIDHVCIVNRSVENAMELAQRLRGLCGDATSTVTVHELDAANACVARAHLIATCTASTKPLFDGNAVREGAFVAAVGSFKPAMVELDAALLLRARVVADVPDEVAATTGEFRSVERSRIVMVRFGSGRICSRALSL